MYKIRTSSHHVASLARQSVWTTTPDADGFHLIVRRVEGRGKYRLELQQTRPHYEPMCTATVSRNQIIGISTPEYFRLEGHAKRLLCLAKTTLFPDLYLSGPVTDPGRKLYESVVAIYPEMADDDYERGRGEACEGSFVRDSAGRYIGLN